MTNGYSGYFVPNGFQNKADALKYAMELSFRMDEKGLYYLVDILPHLKEGDS